MAVGLRGVCSWSFFEYYERSLSCFITPPFEPAEIACCFDIAAIVGNLSHIVSPLSSGSGLFSIVCKTASSSFDMSGSIICEPDVAFCIKTAAASGFFAYLCNTMPVLKIKLLSSGLSFIALSKKLNALSICPVRARNSAYLPSIRVLPGLSLIAVLYASCPSFVWPAK